MYILANQKETKKYLLKQKVPGNNYNFLKY